MSGERKQTSASSYFRGRRVRRLLTTKTAGGPRPCGADTVLAGASCLAGANGSEGGGQSVSGEGAHWLWGGVRVPWPRGWSHVCLRGAHVGGCCGCGEGTGELGGSRGDGAAVWMPALGCGLSVQDFSLHSPGTISCPTTIAHGSVLKPSPCRSSHTSPRGQKPVNLCNFC